MLKKLLTLFFFLSTFLLFPQNSFAACTNASYSPTQISPTDDIRVSISTNDNSHTFLAFLTDSTGKIVAQGEGASIIRIKGLNLSGNYDLNILDQTDNTGCFSNGQKSVSIKISSSGPPINPVGDCPKGDWERSCPTKDWPYCTRSVRDCTITDVSTGKSVGCKFSETGTNSNTRDCATKVPYNDPASGQIRPDVPNCVPIGKTGCTGSPGTKGTCCGNAVCDNNGGQASSVIENGVCSVFIPPFTPNDPLPPPGEIKSFAPCPGNVGATGNCKSILTGLGISIPSDPAGFAKAILGIILGIAGIAALFIIIITGYRLMTSQGDPEKIKAAREQLTAAVVGLVFIIFSVAILSLIGVNILHIPGFK